MARVNSPEPGSTLPGSTVTFAWSGGHSVAEYWLRIGFSRDAGDILDQSMGVSLSATVYDMPTDGREVWLRLSSKIKGRWRRAHYSFFAYDASSSTEPTPEPTPSGPLVYRAFPAASWWNRPMPTNAPIDPNSATYIADAMNTAVSLGHLRITGAPDQLSGEAWSYPIYWATDGDPLYTVVPDRWGPEISIRIPRGATPQSGSDGGLIVFDLDRNTAQELWQARYDAGSDSWSASSTKRYILDSNGLDRRAAGADNPLNDGHRGVATPVRAVRLDEVRSGAIRRRLECFWHATGRPDEATPWHYWPMVGYESGKGGIVPEGIVLRIKPGVNLSSLGLSPAALIIARALQEYGCIIGDNDGGTNNSVKLQRGAGQWAEIDSALSVNSLSVLRWSDWEFIQGGYDPPQP